MPELPDITVYLEALESRIVGETLERTRIPKPFLLRSVDPPISAAQGKRVLGVRRMGKRIVVELEDDLFLVIHLMIAGRLRWVPAGGKVPGKIGLAAFDFTNGTLILTEAGSKRRASLWLVRGEQSLEQFERGGLEVLGVRSRGVHRATDPGEPHLEAIADRSKAVQRNRERVLGRDSPSRKVVARETHPAAKR